MKNAHSYGVIPFILSEYGPLYLMVRHRAGHWSFAKGRPEEGETPVQSALRELAEETGIADCTIITDEPIDEVYEFEHNGEAIHKTVTYFVAEAHNQETSPQLEEVTECRWVSYEECIALASYSATERVIEWARHQVEAFTPGQPA